MKKLFLPVLLPVLSFFALSCEFPISRERPSNPDYKDLDHRSFWAQDLRDNSFYKTEAVRLCEGEKCVIWGEESAGVTQDIAKLIAKEYDTNIYTKIVDVFGMKDISGENDVSIGNSLDWADYMTDGDGKLTILLLDIRDGYKSTLDSYTAGYFTSGNFIKHSCSNETDMMYLDTYPSTLNSPDSYATFAHELQHLINFVNTRVIGRNSMDIWIDEGLSSAAEYIYTGDHPPIRYGWFIEDREGTIARGNNFFVWNNHPEKANAIMDEYATVYLFFQWLRLQSLKSGGEDGYGIYRAIAASEKYDQNAVVNAAKNLFDDPEYAANWETLLRTWLAANYINRSPGPYGYKDDSKLKYIRVSPLLGETQALLYPGEGVYSTITGGSGSPSSGEGGANIRYGGLGINGGTDFVGKGGTYSGNRLLTFNSNNNHEGGTETGFLTGRSTGVSAAGSRQIGQMSGPFIIDARDIGGIREQERNFSFPVFGKKGKDAAP
ncbi:MAG: hypothetical protein LBK02_00830 [Treponema sp.]|nr:hypothetical protein [Treponema sp.]